MSDEIKINKVLIIDDDPDYRRLLVHSLKKFMVETILITHDPLNDGVPDYEYDWGAYDALVLDYNLGIEGVTGLDILTKNISIETFPATVMLTGAGNEEISVRAMKSGVYDYLRKETLNSEGFKRLAESIKEACSKRASEQVKETALEAARNVAKIQAKHMYGEYQSKLKEIQQKEKALIKAEREKLKQEMSKNQQLLADIQKAKSKAESAKQAAQMELEKLKGQKQNLESINSTTGKTQLQQQLKEVQDRLELQKKNLAKTNNQQDLLENEISKSSWKLEQQKTYAQQLETDLEIFDDDEQETVNKKAAVEEKTETDSMLDEINSQLNK